jgi:hypothetical protein
VRKAVESVDLEAHWPASIAVAIAILLQLSLPSEVIPGPRWVIPVLEAILLVPLTIVSPHRHHLEPAWVRRTSLLLIGLVSAANVVSLGLLASRLLGGGVDNGRVLIVAAIQIWLTNVVIFGLWFWELDRGGPGARTNPEQRPPGFLFPQMTSPEATGTTARWRPVFVDYAYVSLTNATAFSPTDTMPLTPWIKVLMSVQALASLVTVAMVAARAVNILS